MLKTPDTIREFQRKLYLKAKQEKSYRFYTLYDKVYRWDILNHAYKLTRENKGAPGIDGLTFKDIEREGVKEFLKGIQEEFESKTYRPAPVRRVYIPKPNGEKRPLGIPTIKDRVVQMACKIVIEPIFEADFQENSYGFRPKRSAHQAVDDVTYHLNRGKTLVIDADISKYFDSIPHDKLLKVIARRIVDKWILRLIKMWLKAPVVVEGKDGKKRYQGGKRSKHGTPQGGVISPLLANIYLNLLDIIWKARGLEKRLKARLIRYCDDFVVLCQKETERTYQVVSEVLERLELRLNGEKTRIVDVDKGSFDFLGFNFRIAKGYKTGKPFPLTRPAKKAIRGIRVEIKALTERRDLRLPTEVVIRAVNERVKGWVEYFYFKNCSRDFSQLREYVSWRVRNFLRRKHRRKDRGYKAFPNTYLYQVLGLYKIPTRAPWTDKVKAFR